MNVVLYYSDTGESKRVAEYIAKQTGYRLTDLTATAECRYEYAVIVFPVYCQNAPQAVKGFLSRLNTKYLVAVATYGKMSYGNVLYEIQRKFNHNIIAAAYVPTKHAYLDEPRFIDFDGLAPLIDKIINAPKCPTSVKIPKSGKNPFADFAPKLRSQIGCKIVKNEKLCNNCRMCETNCALNAVKLGKPNRNCIRCARCVTICPNNALSLHLTYPMRKYLKRKKCNELIVYV